MSASAHEVIPFTLPGRFWKWRMHGGAVTLARRFLESSIQPDLILATDMVDLTTFQSLTRRRTSQIPTAVYFHENQLTYPPPPGAKRDLHYAFINYATLLAAGRVLFNSAYHLDALLDELPRLLKHFPDFNELATVEDIRLKSMVLPLGLNLSRYDDHRPAQVQRDGPLRIMWNHRWEYDKQPQVFFRALYALQSAGVPFEVYLLGESFRNQPEEFLEARERLAEHIVYFGYLQDHAAYARALWEADVQVSCAVQDFFGASTAEAIYCGCLPLLPDRLNYPAFVPAKYRQLCLYHTEEELQTKLLLMAADVGSVRGLSLRSAVARFDWTLMAPIYDRVLGQAIERGPVDPFITE